MHENCSHYFSTLTCKLILFFQTHGWVRISIGDSCSIGNALQMDMEGRQQSKVGGRGEAA